MAKRAQASVEQWSYTVGPRAQGCAAQLCQPLSPRSLPPSPVALPSPLPLRQGGSLRGAQLVYERWGELSAAGDNVVLLFTGLSVSAHARSTAQDPKAGWWEAFIGPGKALDTRRWCVICFNQLGSCFGSTGPASVDPQEGTRYRTRFPVLSVEDIAMAAHEGLRGLGIERVAAVVGPSMGGLAAFAYAALYPDRLDHLLVVSAAQSCEPYTIAIHALQRQMVHNDPRWQAGRYSEEAPPCEGMYQARKLGMISYRSAKEWQARFGRKRLEGQDPSGFGMLFEVESYLENRARSFAAAFDANSYLYLSRAMDLFDLAEHGGLEEVGRRLSEAQVRVQVIGVPTDVLFPVAQQQALVALFQAQGVDASLVVLDSIQGHDAFLVDTERFCPAVADFMAGAASTRAVG